MTTDPANDFCDAAKLELLRLRIEQGKLDTIGSCDWNLHWLDHEIRGLDLEISKHSGPNITDPEHLAWLREARADLKFAKSLRQRVQNVRGELTRAQRRAEQDARDKVFEQRFVRAAKTTLPEDTYQMLVRIASMTEGEPS